MWRDLKLQGPELCGTFKGVKNNIYIFFLCVYICFSKPFLTAIFADTNQTVKAGAALVSTGFTQTSQWIGLALIDSWMNNSPVFKSNTALSLLKILGGKEEMTDSSEWVNVTSSCKTSRSSALATVAAEHADQTQIKVQTQTETISLPTKWSYQLVRPTS